MGVATGGQPWASKEGQEGPGVSAQSPCPSFWLQAVGGSSAELCPPQAAD